MQMNHNIKSMNNLVDNSNEVDKKIDVAISEINQTAEMAKKSELISQNLASSTQDIIDNINTLDDISTQNTKSIEAIDEKALILQKDTRELNEHLSLFKV
jgi:methyl-accepting chemotaxis protein